MKVEGQTVGRWERGETSIDSTADNYIRILYALYALDDSADDIKSFVDMMADLDSKKVHKELKFTKLTKAGKPQLSTEFCRVSLQYVFLGDLTHEADGFCGGQNLFQAIGQIVHVLIRMEGGRGQA